MITQSKSQRNSNVELLRVIAMFMILFSHSSVHGQFPSTISLINFNNYFLDWIKLGNIGVNIFILISGYFLCYKEKNLTSLLKLLTQVWFYSILCYYIYIYIYIYIMGESFVIKIKDIIMVLMPTIFQEYWFFTVYVVLLLLTPYINKFIHNSSRTMLNNSIIVMILLWSFIPSLSTKHMYGTDLSVFIMLYIIGAYLRIYQPVFLYKYRYIITIIFFILLFISSVIIRLASCQISILDNYINYFYNRFSIISIGASVGLFSIFIFIRPQVNSLINILGSTVFGIYLIHDNPFLRKLIWTKWFDNSIFYDSPFLFYNITISVSIIFVICFFIEFFRKKYIEENLYRFIMHILKKNEPT